MNCFSVVFLSASFFSAGLLQLLYYSAGEGTITHRLASAVSLYFIVIVVSALCSVTVIEASKINDMVPEIRTWLKRETLAIAAQLAHLAHVAAQEALRVKRDGEGTAHVEESGRPSSSAGLSHLGKSSTTATLEEGEQLRSALRLIDYVDQYIHHEEEQNDPEMVFNKIPASPAAVTVTVSSLLTMLLVALQRLYTMCESEGWSYRGDMGEFDRI